MFTIVTASHDQNIFAANLGRSKILSKYPVIVQRGYTNIAQAYNDVKTPLANYVIYVHHDVFLPDNFEDNLRMGIAKVSEHNWGVIGVAGVRLVDGKKVNHGFISDRGEIWAAPSQLPHEVDTLDEMLLVTNGDLPFDERLNQDFYGADICMAAKAMGKKNFAVNAFCEHNSSRAVRGRTPQFYESEKYFRKRWKEYLPIATTCTIIK